MSIIQIECDTAYTATIVVPASDWLVRNMLSSYYDIVVVVNMCVFRAIIR